MRDDGGKVVINAAKFIAKCSGWLETAFHEGLSILVEAAEAAQRQATYGLQRNVKDGVNVGIEHVRLGFVELGNLCNQMEMFERDLVRQF
jgi:hypothetical protein